MSVVELGHLLTRSGLTYLVDSSEVCHDSFCQLANSVSLSWVVCHEAFCLHVVSSSSFIPVVSLCICHVKPNSLLLWGQATSRTVRGSYLGRSKRFSSSPKRPDRLWDPPRLLVNGVNLSGREYIH